MDLQMNLKNYRCFPDSKPATFMIRDGFTAFLGVNNSGKSSILRFFFEFRNLFQLLSSPSNHSYANAIKNQPQTFNTPSTVEDINELFYKGNTRDIEITITCSGELTSNLQDGGHGGLVTTFTIHVIRGTNTYTLDPVIPSGSGPNYKKQNLSSPEPEFVVLKNESGAPIADLSLVQKSCQQLSSTLYLPSFRNAINVGERLQFFDIDVGQGFIRKWKEAKTGRNRQQNEAVDRLQEDICHIFDFRKLEINPSPDETSMKLLINGKSFNLSELGSGLAQFILVLANAATRQQDYILIDEPELNLHPSLQLDFLTTLGSYAKKGVLFATHSYGLARARAQDVYTTVKPSQDEGSEVRPLLSTPRLSELLGELGFSAYKELGFEKVLLVEGPTEVLTIQEFLRTYQKDHKIVLIPLGGSSLITGDREIQLQEITRITPHVFALIDSERTAAGNPLEADREAFRKTCEKLNITCHVLERRATENYLTDRAVKEALSQKHGQLGPYDRLKDAKPSWSKGINWRIARLMRKEELDDTDLGKFLESL